MNKEKHKVLILGIGQSNFLNQLYSQLLVETGKYNFYINDYFDLSKGKVGKENKIYSDFFNFRRIKISKRNLYYHFIQFSFDRFFWKILFFEISQRKSLKDIKNILGEMAQARFRVKKLIEPLHPEIVHFHFCIPQNIRELYFLSPEIKCICSFWGSDLLRMTGVSNVFYLQNALERTSKITIQSPELGETLLTKYGRGLQNKLEYIRFPLEPKIFDEIDANRNDYKKLRDFKIKYTIPLDKKIIAVGHNAFRENNHLKIIGIIEKLPSKYLEDVVVLLHLSYGGNESYKNQLKNLSCQTNIKIVVVEEYLDKSEIALLRLITDILIQMPISDALSAAVTEVLYAKGMVVSGSWLPYGFFQRNNIKLFEVESFNNLKIKLEELLDNDVKYLVENNPLEIRKTFLSGMEVKQWLNLLNSLISQ
ncbi:glycosyltransferase [Salegentibacter maritimus]|uniref:glycosyltransferase n=1 Tax=Salegentibacter maritimus TaxID=2794347 RepID=UPI0018E4B3FE|nr:glycosyltransferase [Salegentibacter maritimus]MBI6118186.1 glycosyltransferase [Salegentibacter maritimus]